MGGRLRLDRARAQQQMPVRLARRHLETDSEKPSITLQRIFFLSCGVRNWRERTPARRVVCGEGGGHEDEVGAFPRERGEELGKAQVVAGRQAHSPELRAEKRSESEIRDSSRVWRRDNKNETRREAGVSTTTARAGPGSVESDSISTAPPVCGESPSRQRGKTGAHTRRCRAVRYRAPTRRRGGPCGSTRPRHRRPFLIESGATKPRASFDRGFPSLGVSRRVSWRAAFLLSSVHGREIVSSRGPARVDDDVRVRDLLGLRTRALVKAAEREPEPGVSRVSWVLVSRVERAHARLTRRARACRHLAAERKRLRALDSQTSALARAPYSRRARRPRANSPARSSRPQPIR